MKASSKRPHVKSSTGDASNAAPSGDPTADDFMDPTIDVYPPSSTSSSLSMHTMLETCLTVQVTHGQILLDLPNEVTALRADLAHTRGASPPAPPSDES